MLSQSLHPKVVISLTFFPKWSSAYPPTQRQSLAHLLGEVSNVLYGWWHLHGCSLAKSPSASSSMAVHWWLSSLESPGREATMQGFPKVILPTEVITVSPGITPVASKFSLPMEVVTVSIHGLSPPTWSEGVGETGSSPGTVVGMIWVCHGRASSLEVHQISLGAIVHFSHWHFYLFFGENFSGHRQVSLSRQASRFS